MAVRLTDEITGYGSQWCSGQQVIKPDCPTAMTNRTADPLRNYYMYMNTAADPFIPNNVAGAWIENTAPAVCKTYCGFTLDGTVA